MLLVATEELGFHLGGWEQRLRVRGGDELGSLLPRKSQPGNPLKRGSSLVLDTGQMYMIGSESSHELAFSGIYATDASVYHGSKNSRS